MKKHYRRKKIGRRRRSLSSSNWGPIIKLLSCLLGGLAAIGLLVLLIMFILEAVFKVDTPLPPDGIVAGISKLFTNDDVLIVTPTPYYSPVPTATPHPMDEYNAQEEEKEVVLPQEQQYFWFGDPSFNSNKLLFSAGKIVGSNVQMCALLEYDPESGAVFELPIKPKNANFIYPVKNDEWLVYLDAKSKGGGDICAYRVGQYNSDPIIIKTVYVGQPEIRLDGHYISWIERTGTNKDKLFVCDLETQESTVIAMFSSSSYGTSSPYMFDGTLIWASDGTSHFDDDRMASTIKHIDLNSSGIKEYEVDTYVHNPQFNGQYFVWLDGHYSKDSTLYYAKVTDDNKLESHAIESGVVNYAIDENFVIYSVDEAIYVFYFNSGKSFRITPERELAQLLGASEGHAIWMDVTTRQRDVLKYSSIPSE